MNPTATGDTLASDFVKFSVASGVLRFGEFKTKAGRLSPYFFNSGLFDDGAKLTRLAEFYARRLLASGVEFDMALPTRASRSPPALPSRSRTSAATCRSATTARKRRTTAKAA